MTAGSAHSTASDTHQRCCSGNGARLLCWGDVSAVTSVENGTGFSINLHPAVRFWASTLACRNTASEGHGVHYVPLLIAALGTVAEVGNRQRVPVADDWSVKMRLLRAVGFCAAAKSGRTEERPAQTHLTQPADVRRAQDEEMFSRDAQIALGKRRTGRMCNQAPGPPLSSPVCR